MTYQTKFAQKAAEIYERYKSEVTGSAGMVLKAFAPSIPTVLRYIDDDAELRQKLGDMLKELSEALEEDSGNKKIAEGGDNG